MACPWVTTVTGVAAAVAAVAVAVAVEAAAAKIGMATVAEMVVRFVILVRVVVRRSFDGDRVVFCSCSPCCGCTLLVLLLPQTALCWSASDDRLFSLKR